LDWREKTLLALFCFTAAIAALGAAGARFNTSGSIAVGLYWRVDSPPEKGRYVMFCPPKKEAFDLALARHYIAAGSCPGGYGKMMKRILAAKNDEVTTTDEGVFVNGKLLPHSAILKADQGGRGLPRWSADRYRLKGEELLLMTDVLDTSFDSRYFGLVGQAQIVNVIRPVFTF
jgi:conjugative transfer signal peptidase TraF